MYKDRFLHLFCNVLASVIKVAGIKRSISGMVIDGRGQIGLYLCTVFPNGQFGIILDVTLDQYHAVRLG